jgi:hypothetical protein
MEETGFSRFFDLGNKIQGRELSVDQDTNVSRLSVGMKRRGMFWQDLCVESAPGARRPHTARRARSQERCTSPLSIPARMRSSAML